MDLAAALEGAELPPAARDLEVLGVAADSRQVGAGDLFVAIRGARFDGLAHAEEAVARGAAGDRQRPAGSAGHRRRPGSPSPRRAGRSRCWRPRLHGDPAEKLVLAAVTGTNGKTSTTTLLEAILAAGGTAPPAFSGPWAIARGAAASRRTAPRRKRR